MLKQRPRCKGCRAELIHTKDKERGYCTRCAKKQNRDSPPATKEAQAKTAIEQAVKAVGQDVNGRSHKTPRKPSKPKAKPVAKDVNALSGPNSESIGTRVSPKAAEAVRELAKKRKETMSQCIRRLILEGLAK